MIISLPSKSFTPFLLTFFALTVFTIIFFPKNLSARSEPWATSPSWFEVHIDVEESAFPEDIVVSKKEWSWGGDEDRVFLTHRGIGSLFVLQSDTSIDLSPDFPPGYDPVYKLDHRQVYERDFTENNPGKSTVLWKKAIAGYGSTDQAELGIGVFNNTYNKHFPYSRSPHSHNIPLVFPSIEEDRMFKESLSLSRKNRETIEPEPPLPDQQRAEVLLYENGSVVRVPVSISYAYNQEAVRMNTPELVAEYNKYLQTSRNNETRIFYGLILIPLLIGSLNFFFIQKSARKQSRRTAFAIAFCSTPLVSLPIYVAGFIFRMDLSELFFIFVVAVSISIFIFHNYKTKKIPTSRGWKLYFLAISILIPLAFIIGTVLLFKS